MIRYYIFLEIICSGGKLRPVIPTKNISNLLDSLLQGYDRRLRPNFGGDPTIVEIDVEVRSMGQISEMDMTYSMDCYFRQSWVDDRLKFLNSVEDSFTLSLAVLEKLWKPDTFIYNGKNSYTHLLTTPNRFVRLHHSGKILYSSRITIKATCPMHLQYFPMDTQECPLNLGSFGYTTRDVIYRWNKKRQIVIAADMKLSQFDIAAAPSSQHNITRKTGVYTMLKSGLYFHRNMGYFLIHVYFPCSLIIVLSWVSFWINREATADRCALEQYSTLLASFYLQRHMGNFFIQVYGPCMLLVVLSWVSFWLNREATSDRISLGVTTILTMTFLGLEARKDLPKVQYSTALDVFVWLSFAFIFATILEFAFVHYYTKYGSGEYIFSNDSDDDDEMIPPLPFKQRRKRPQYPLAENECEICSKDELSNVQQLNCDLWNASPESVREAWREDCHSPRRQSVAEDELPPNNVLQGPTESRCSLCGGNKGETIDKSEQCNYNRDSTMSRWMIFCTKRRRKRVRMNLSPISRQKRVKLARLEERHNRLDKAQQMNSVSHIDVASRMLFPLAFLLINLIYWYIYLSHSQSARLLL